MSDPVLSVIDASVAYGERPVLQGVSLTVAASEVVAVLGANGSGKSTLVKAALGIVSLNRGEAALFGTDVRRFRQWTRLGYVPQRLGAASGVPATVAEVVGSGRLGRRRLGQPRRDADKVAVAEALRAMGLQDRAADPVASLSGGQQQRALIARALAGEPELLVLDEPTAGVDAASQHAFTDALHDFVHGGGTVVLVAHELGPLQQIISRAVVVHGGQIVHDGPPPEPAGHHADPDHVHVHPHAPIERPGWWGS